MLGIEIFERKPRSMVPTELGNAVAAYARTILNDTEKFTTQLNTLRKGGQGHLRIGAIFAATFNVVPQAIQQVKAIRPLLSIEIIEQTSDKLLVMLERKEIDLVIGRLNESRHHPLFDFVKLATESFVLVGHARHRNFRTQTAKHGADRTGQCSCCLRPYDSE